jgi:uncharacterized surface protein with fasciclin (FAS1) repeats
MSNIVDVVVADRNLGTLLRSFNATKLAEDLRKTGPFTVFAPTDLAFGKLAAGEMTELMKPENNIKLTGILNQHVVQGKTNFKDLVDGQKLKTVNGKEFSVEVKNGAVSINGARIQGRDMEASNGVVHSLDKVIQAN